MERVYNGFIMVATIETTLELGPRAGVRGCRVTATYPQGGTGIAAGEVSYPGAAARSRCLGTGFLAVGTTITIVGLLIGGPIGVGVGFISGTVGGLVLRNYLPAYGPTSAVGGAPEFVPMPPVLVNGQTPEPP